MTIEQQVKHHRLSLGLEIRQFADKIGVDVTYVSYYELGLKEIRQQGIRQNQRSIWH